MNPILTVDSAKAYAAKTFGGVATYARHDVTQDAPCIHVRIRRPDFAIWWATVWVESGKHYGEA